MNKILQILFLTWYRCTEMGNVVFEKILLIILSIFLFVYCFDMLFAMITWDDEMIICRTFLPESICIYIEKIFLGEE